MMYVQPSSHDRSYQPNSLDRSYQQLPSHTSRLPPQRVPSNAPYVPSNEFLTTYEAEEPDYVKYYKRKPETGVNPKMGLGMPGRGNPFRQNA